MSASGRPGWVIRRRWVLAGLATGAVLGAPAWFAIHRLNDAWRACAYWGETGGQCFAGRAPSSDLVVLGGISLAAAAVWFWFLSRRSCISARRRSLVLVGAAAVFAQAVAVPFTADWSLMAEGGRGSELIFVIPAMVGFTALALRRLASAVVDADRTSIRATASLVGTTIAAGMLGMLTGSFWPNLAILWMLPLALVMTGVTAHRHRSDRGAWAFARAYPLTCGVLYVVIPMLLVPFVIWGA